MAEPIFVHTSEATHDTAPDPRATERPPRKKSRRLDPRLWVSIVPNGLDRQKPNHYGEMVRTIRENWRHLPYAWRILRKGVCDGCALGVAGFRDWTIDGVHLCTTRLNLLQVNTMGALDPKRLADVEALRALDGAELRKLGRLPYPMLRRRGEPGFQRVSWDEALDLAAKAVDTARKAPGDRLGFYLTARGLLNETYYVAQKVARFLGTNSVDNAARICHAPSTGALRHAVGVAATTCSYTDVIESDLTVLFGADVANAQPVFMKYLYMQKKRGGTVAVVNPFREPGLEHYWVPSNPESAIFGTKITDEFFAVNVGGDIAFLDGVLKVLIEEGGVDEDFVARHTSGWSDLSATLATMRLDDLAGWAGSTVDDFRRFARMYARAKSAVLVWSMGITQHVCGTDNVSAIINLALARGNVGRPGAGLMPIRGHSGVQGGAEMGCYATVFPGGVPISGDSAQAMENEWHFPLRHDRGRSAAEMVEAAGAGELDVLWSVGGNFLDTLPDPSAVADALERTPLRVHQDIVVSSQMLVDGEAVLLLPATTRYEQPGGGTETTTERRVAFSPEISHPKVGEARAEWQVLLHLARLVEPDRALELCSFDSAQAIREEIVRVVPFYEGIQHLKKTGDAIQWGGERLCDGWVFPTLDGKAHFASVRPREIELAPGRFLLATRRGKQFNSMVWKQRDPLTGADRDALFMAESDARDLGVGDGDAVTVRSSSGEVSAHIKVARIRAGNVQMFFPEANPVIRPGMRDPVALVPDYNALVEVIPATSGLAMAARALDSRPTPAASGIVLAGGRSSRFGRDKLAEMVEDEPLLARAIRAVGAVCGEVIVVGRAEAPGMPDLAVPVRFVPDREPFRGPLAGLAAAADAANETLLLVVAGDMPSLRPDVLRLMLQQLADADGTYRYDVSQGVRLALGGRPEPLPLIIDRGAAISAAQDLGTTGNTSLKALGSVLTLVTIPEADWRALDPDGATLRDVDHVEDLSVIA